MISAVFGLTLAILAIRFTTLTRICEVLGCQPGDLLTVRSAPSES